MDEYAAMAAGISAMGNVAAAAINSDGSHKSQWRAYDINKRLADYQNAINIQNWQMQNEYNSPTNQMKRLDDAGLNPNLVYGKGADNTATSLPSYQAQRFDAVNTAAPWANSLSSTSRTAVEALMQSVGIEKQIQETKNLATYQQSMTQDIELKKLDYLLKAYSVAENNEKSKYLEQLVEQQLLGMKANSQLKFAQRDYIKDVQAPLGYSQIDLNHSAELRNDASRGLTDAQIVTENITRMAKLDMIKSQISENLSRVGLNNKQVEYVMQQINNAKWDSRLKSATLDGKKIDNWLNQYLINTGVNLKGSGLNSIIHGIGRQTDRLFSEGFDYLF